ncbi:ankyrin repeat-containing domain protein [Pavlovales sp. CCMP2436]|nr:ankyrin repeat-containing domain protein [Pavlovales sp. CCMP2436]
MSARAYHGALWLIERRPMRAALLLALAAALCAPGDAYVAPSSAIGARARVAVRGRVLSVRAAEEDGVTIRVKMPSAGATAPPPMPAAPEGTVTVRMSKAVEAASLAVDATVTAVDDERTVTVRAPEPAAPRAEQGTVGSYNEDLLEAARTGSVRIIKACLEKGASCDAQDPQGFSALHLCCATGLAPGVVLLVKAGANINYRTQNLTPLTIAIGYNKPFTCEVLVKLGARMDEPDAEGITPVAFVASLIKTEVDNDAEKKASENAIKSALTNVINKRLDSLLLMEKALQFAPTELGRVPEEKAFKNLEEMYAEIAEIMEFSKELPAQ